MAGSDLAGRSVSREGTARILPPQAGPRALGPASPTSLQGSGEAGRRLSALTASVRQPAASCLSRAPRWRKGGLRPRRAGRPPRASHRAPPLKYRSWKPDYSRSALRGIEGRGQEISRLAGQIRRLYGSNKKASKPFWLYLTNFIVNSPIYEECLRMNDGFSNYLMDMTEESYLDLFPLETVVYLTPDSEHALEDIDPRKVYILGGLVDESIQKKLTFQKAQENGLVTARLPIQEWMVKNVNEKNYHSEILAINQVFDVLSTYYETQSWPEALKAGVPCGNGFVIPDTDE
ncbi:tRNA methyltransferase 10 homolog B isoform X2 [Lissotriton helveticus]